MAIDVKRGDIFDDGSKTYAVKYVGSWKTTRMNTAGFKNMANVAVTIKRQPFSTGAAGTPTTVWSGNATPLDPINTTRLNRIDLDKILKSPTEALQTFIADDSEFKFILLEDIQQ